MTTPERDRFRLVAELSLEEIVEVQMRYERRAGTIRRQQWMIAALIPLFVLLAAWRGWTLRHMLTPQGWIPLLLLLLFGAATPMRWRRYLMRTRHRILGGAESIRHEYEIGERSVSVTTPGRESRFDWSSLIEARLDAGGIELWFTPLALVMIPRRCFAAPAELEQWVGGIERLTGRTVRRAPDGGR